MGNGYIPKDSEFKDFYGKGHFLPEVKVGISIYNGFYLWGGYGYYKATGKTTPDFQEETEWTQNFWFYGGGYYREFLRSLGFNLRLGGVTTTYKEEALDSEIKETASGFYIGGGIVLSLAHSFFTELELGYISVSNMIDDLSINLGGFKAGIGVGIRI